jgi:hypothetical protein
MSEHPSPISDDQITVRARQIWEAEGQPEGKAEEHWARAQSELRAELAHLAAATPPAVVPTVTGIS